MEFQNIPNAVQPSRCLSKIDLLLQGPCGVIYHSIEHAGHCENSAHNGAHARQKVCEGATVFC